jgi:hypothetical protein
MTTEKTRPDYRAAFAGVGTYAITWKKDGSRKTVTRWINSADELVELMDGWIIRGYDITKVAYRGQS